MQRVRAYQTDSNQIARRFLNLGPGGVPVNVYVTLWLDGTMAGTWSAPKLAPNHYTWFVDYELGPLAAGGHTLRLNVGPPVRNGCPALWAWLESRLLEAKQRGYFTD